MDLGIKGKIALVTGGVQGIGTGITRVLLEEGATVIPTSRQQPAIDEFLASLPPALRERCQPLCLGLTDDDELSRLCTEVLARHDHVDILVNNAGHTLNITDPHCSLDDWRAVMRLNFEVPVELSRRFIPGMRQHGWGRIVNITSCAGLENSGPVTFSAAKAALTAYSRSMGRVLATEGGQIVMTAVYPGVIATKGGHWDKILQDDPARAEKYLADRCPLGRFGEVDEFSPVVAFYCSQLASFCHGSIVGVDGGQSKHYNYQTYL